MELATPTHHPPGRSRSRQSSAGAEPTCLRLHSPVTSLNCDHQPDHLVFKGECSDHQPLPPRMTLQPLRRSQQHHQHYRLSLGLLPALNWLCTHLDPPYRTPSAPNPPNEIGPSPVANDNSELNSHAPHEPFTELSPYHISQSKPPSFFNSTIPSCFPRGDVIWTILLPNAG